MKTRILWPIAAACLGIAAWTGILPYAQTDAVITSTVSDTRHRVGLEGVLADLHIRSEIGAIVACSGQFASSVTFRHNLPHHGTGKDMPMRLVKRAAITVTPKQPYIDWANRLDEDGVKIGEDFQPERHVYLIGDVSRCFPI